jgi:hypothetical protein
MKNGDGYRREGIVQKIVISGGETWNAESNPDDRWWKFSYQELIARDKTSFDVFWLKD